MPNKGLLSEIQFFCKVSAFAFATISSSKAETISYIAVLRTSAMAKAFAREAKLLLLLGTVVPASRGPTWTVVAHLMLPGPARCEGGGLGFLPMEDSTASRQERRVDTATVLEPVNWATPNLSSWRDREVNAATVLAHQANNCKSKMP